jgi:hypothetical protein
MPLSSSSLPLLQLPLLGVEVVLLKVDWVEVLMILDELLPVLLLLLLLLLKQLLSPLEITITSRTLLAAPTTGTVETSTESFSSESESEEIVSG